MKIFCISYAGGDCRALIPLSKTLQKHQAVLLERPGRGRRIAEPLLGDIDLIVEDLLKQIRLHVNADYAIYGHSMGARLAFLLCRRLRQLQLPLPQQLFVSGQQGPSLKVKDEHVWQLPSKEFWEHLKDLGGCPDTLLEHPELMELFEDIIRADFQAISSFNYQQQTPFDFPITVMLGDQEETSIEEAQCWQQESSLPMELKIFNGHHFFINSHWSEIAALIESNLDNSLVPSL
ncbi:MAG: thioesterase [Lentisphaeraceae bacterium]|nr:thioesterase [Lentisphaeraceae bacterium]